MFNPLKSSLALSGILYLLLGFFLVGWPDTSLKICCYGLGALLLLGGAVQIWRFISRREEGLFFPRLGLVCGIICLAAGLFLFLQPGAAISLFPILFGLFVVLDSFSRFENAMALRRAGYGRWGWFLALSLLSICLGLFMILNPFATAAAMVTAVGVILLVEGFFNLFGQIFSRLTLARMEKELRRQEQALNEALDEAITQEKARRHGVEGPVQDVSSRPVDEDQD